jgi:hypothetical protein
MIPWSVDFAGHFEEVIFESELLKGNPWEIPPGDRSGSICPLVTVLSQRRGIPQSI